MEPQSRFEQLFRAHAGAVRAYAARRIEPGDADDVVAEVFLVAWRRVDELPDAPLPWLLGVARRVVANRRRGSARRSALYERLADASADGLDVPEIEGVVAAALRTLSESDRELLLLIAWEGLRHAEAAQVLGIRKGAVTVRVHRARRRFAQALAEAERGGVIATGVSETTEVIR